MSIGEKLTTIAENEQKVYDKGRENEWSDFWDVFQDYGNRTKYGYTFWHSWNDKIFRPKYDIKPTNGEYMFANSYSLTDLKGILKECNVVLNTSKATYMTNAFNNCSGLIRLPEISFESVLNNARIQGAFAGCYALESIDKVIYPTDVYLATTNTFSNCRKLSHLRIGGVIGENFNVSWCPLDTDSVIDIILHLVDYKETENAGIYSLALKDTCKTAMANLGAIAEFGGKTYDAYLTDIGWNLA